MQVHGGGEQHVHALAPCLAGQQGADLLDPTGIPRRGQGRRARHVGRAVPLVEGLAADPGRPVGHDEPAQPGLGLGVQGPEVRPGEQPDLLLQGQQASPAPQLGLAGGGSSGYGGHGQEAGRSTRAASAARCASGVPNAIESAFARFRYRCAGCSQVKPMPPCNWTHSCAACTAASEQ